MPCSRVGGLSSTNTLSTAIRFSKGWFGGSDFYCFFPEYPKPDVVQQVAGVEAHLPALLKQFLDLAREVAVTYTGRSRVRAPQPA